VAAGAESRQAGNPVQENLEAEKERKQQVCRSSGIVVQNVKRKCRESKREKICEYSEKSRVYEIQSGYSRKRRGSIRVYGRAVQE